MEYVRSKSRGDDDGDGDGDDDGLSTSEAYRVVSQLSLPLKWPLRHSGLGLSPEVHTRKRLLYDIACVGTPYNRL